MLLLGVVSAAVVHAAANVRYVDRYLEQVQPQPTQIGTNCKWLNWGAWGGCEGLCGHGQQKRHRRCLGGVPGEGNCCPGDDCDSKPCINPVGDTCAYWSGWTEWSACSTSCGAGYRRKHRSCYGQDIAKGYDCDGDNFIEEPCLIGNGDYFQWSTWSACSATCGEAIRTRRAGHSCGAPEKEEVESCDLLDCCDPTPWSDWTPCSVTCFTGYTERTHGWTCDYKLDIVERKACNAGDGFYSDWAPWGQCSQTCQGGYQSRERSHSCGDTNSRGIGYVLGDTQTCGVEGQWSLWSDYSECSSTCPGGSMRRARQHECTNRIEYDVGTCGLEGYYLEWSAWSSCSASCVGGIQYRNRHHSCSADVDVEQQNCGEVGEWDQWSQWSRCSSSCLGGQRLRHRFHSCGAAAVSANLVESSKETEMETCGEVGDFGAWSNWSGCNVSCGGGLSDRYRRHQCSAETEEESQLCNDNCCPAWNDWSEWSACSITCTTNTDKKGYRKRYRKCNSPVPSCGGAKCYGAAYDKEDCTPNVRCPTVYY